MPPVSEPPLYRTMFAFLGAVIGGFVVWLLSSRELHVKPLGVSYLDLAAVALTAVTVILAVFGLAAAAAALVGYREFMKRSAAVAGLKAQEVAVPAAILEVKSYLDTNLDPDIRARARTIATQVLTPEYLRMLIVEQIDHVAYGSRRDERLDLAVEPSGDQAVADDFDDLDALDAAESLDREENAEQQVEERSGDDEHDRQ